MKAGEPDEEPRDPTAFATTIISIKSFLKFVSCYAVSSATIACMLIDIISKSKLIR